MATTAAQPAPAAPAAKDKDKKGSKPTAETGSGTEYVVLEEVDVEGRKLWAEVGAPDIAIGSNPDAAIKSSQGDKSGAYRAVPARSWRPDGVLEIETEQKPVTTVKRRGA